MEVNNLIINWICHSSFQIVDKVSRRIIYIDPFEVASNPNIRVLPADIIFITHEHYDHCNPEAIKRIVKPSTIIVTIADCQSRFRDIKFAKLVLVEPNKNYAVEGINIAAVPAYNTNKMFHPKQNMWVGFVIELNGTRLYHAGDTDLIPEMQNLSNARIDIAMLPISGTYVMNPEEAAKAAELIRPKAVIPMHYGVIVGTKDDLEHFKRICKIPIFQ